MKLKTLMAAAIAVNFAGVSLATAAEPQEMRKEMMEKIGKAMGGLVGIVKGKTAYDAEVVKASLTTISENIKAFPDQFPKGSETGHKTEASPKIWENFDDFKSKAAKLHDDAEALLAALPADQAAVGAAVKTLGADCGACHETYRLKD
ncbi:c-type cytochrome [Gellertiella hungarica]|uniref:Cytochrome c556 n=1 Tax=Gellertiella hungarica TaxID=1572859 RepID=A0A7W6J3Y6_9HYPH|nr:cytochrome c [Gellertiella hungarica]MBB4063501.1 cytochrome c556 [Gellertiella hungarica]